MSEDDRNPGPRERLMRAGEVLIATGGPSVALRDIALGAGIRNNSAVNYHFGSREGLVEAIVLDRVARMEEDRARAVATLPDDAGIHDLVAILVAAMLRVPYGEGATHYARFLDQVRSHPVITEGMDDEERYPATREVLRRIVPHLDLEGLELERRLRALGTTLFALAADRERALADGDDTYDVDEVTEMLVGLLQGCPP